MKRILAVFMLASVSLLAAAVPAQTAKKPPKVPKLPKITALWADIEVAGGITVDSRYDGLTECLPGQAWRLVEWASIGLKGRVAIGITRGRVGSTPARKPLGGSEFKTGFKQTTDLSDYRTSNYCEGKPAKLKKPQCKPKITGNGWFNIASYPGRLTPVVAMIRRWTGANQNRSCLGPDIDKYSLYSELHPFRVKGLTMVLPLKLDALDLRDLAPGETHRTHIKLSGRCDNVNPEVTSWVSGLSLTASSDSCTVRAWFRVAIARPAKKKPKKGKKGKKGKALKKGLQPRIGAPNTAS